VKMKISWRAARPYSESASRTASEDWRSMQAGKDSGENSGSASWRRRAAASAVSVELVGSGRRRQAGAWKSKKKCWRHLSYGGKTTAHLVDINGGKQRRTGVLAKRRRTRQLSWRVDDIEPNGGVTPHVEERLSERAKASLHAASSGELAGRKAEDRCGSAGIRRRCDGRIMRTAGARNSRGSKSLRRRSAVLRR